MIRWIVRPNTILTTPRILQETFNARSIVRIKPHRTYSYNRDFLLTYPPIEQIEEFGGATPSLRSHSVLRRRNPLPLPTEEEYRNLVVFFKSSKLQQRRAMEQSGILVPQSWGTASEANLRLQAVNLRELLTDYQYVVRPRTHSRGLHYRITNDPLDFIEGQEYVSVLFPKRHEYRVIFSRGHLICTLVKRVPEGIDPAGPWNHASGSSFVTVTDPNLNRLRHYDVIERLSNFPIIKTAHLVGADILLSRDNYVVTEINFAPAMTIPSNLERLKHHVYQVLQGPRAYAA